MQNIYYSVLLTSLTISSSSFVWQKFKIVFDWSVGKMKVNVVDGTWYSAKINVRYDNCNGNISLDKIGMMKNSIFYFLMRFILFLIL